MPYLLRKLNKKTSWWPTNADNLSSWIQPFEPQGDALSELQTKGNRLSLWYIEDDNSNLQQILGAIAATRNAAVDLDFVLLDVRALKDAGFEYTQKDGETPDQECNLRWHFDLVQLSAPDLLTLARLIQNVDPSRRRRERKKEIKRLLKEGLDNRKYDLAQMNEELLRMLESN